MTNRKPLVAMTWTMRQNKSLEARTYAKQLRKLLGEEQQIDLVLFPSMGTIYVAAEELKIQIYKLVPKRFLLISMANIQVNIQ